MFREGTPRLGVRYVSRQPILDLRSKVHAYELLFSSGQGNAPSCNREMAARTMLDSTVLFGLEKLTCGLPGFVKCTAEMLTGSLVEMLPPAMTVLELVDAVKGPPELLDACRNLKAAGYRLALDQSIWDPQAKPFVTIADYLKVDFLRTSPRERQTLRGQVGDTMAALVAEKVETQEQFRAATDEGFALVQGYYFCRPVVLGSRQIPANRLSQLEILRLLKLRPSTSSVRRAFRVSWPIYPLPRCGSVSWRPAPPRQFGRIFSRIHRLSKGLESRGARRFLWSPLRHRRA